MRVLRAADHKRMPWKNGGGETTEIAVFPEDAGLDDFQWRVSMARVDGDGPFSSFPGIDRTLAILEGAGIVLDVEGHAPARLTQESQPHPFPADVPTSAALISGPIIDLNVMSRRSGLHHDVQRIEAASDIEGTGPCMILCSDGQAEISTAGTSCLLARFDAMLFEGNYSAGVTPAPGSTLYRISFRDLASSVV